MKKKRCYAHLYKSGVWTSAFISPMKLLRRGMPQSFGSYVFNFFLNVKKFPKVVLPVYILNSNGNADERYSSSTSLSFLGMVSLFSYRYYNRYILISPVVLISLVTNDVVMSSIFLGLFDICIYSVIKYAFKSFAIFIRFLLSSSY